MFKKITSVFLALSLISATGVISAGATDTTQKSNANESDFKIIHPIIKNNLTTYYDEDGNVVDIAEYNREIKVSENTLPASYDLRDEGRSTSVKNQGKYGFCWDFASTASIESSVLSNPELRAQLGENPSEALDLSEVGNTWYIHTNIDDENSYLYDDYIYDESKGSNGGNSTIVATSLSNGFGAYSEELLPYEMWGNQFSEGLRFYSDYRLKEYVLLENDVALIKQRLKDFGAMYISYNEHSSNYNMVDGMQAYYDNGEPIDSSCEDSQSHAVTIIGWDDNFSKDNFCEEMQPSNDGAWLCKNSWGEDNCSTAEGYEGYFWMSYETDVREPAQYVMQSVDEFDNIYQHQFTSGNSAEVSTVSNVFAVENDEVLEQICFSNIGSDDLTVEIYKLNDNFTSPVDGEILTSFETSVDFSGIHYIDVTSEVVLNAGDIFSVVLKAENGIYIDYKSGYANDDLSGKSYVVNEDNEWLDVADSEDLSYMSIKACTSNKDNAVYKTELSQLVDTAKNIVIGETVSQNVVDDFNAQLENAENVLNDSTASQNKVDNTFCLLKSAMDAIENYQLDINNVEDYIDFYNSSLNGKCTARYISLNTDLDLSQNGTMMPLFNSYVFSGTFNGNGHTISNLTVEGDTNAGFFGDVSDAEIMNVNFDNFKVTGVTNVTDDSSFGVVTGNAQNTLISDCMVTNSTVISNGYTGGLAGNAQDTRIIDCTVTNSTVIGSDSYAGGLAGNVISVEIKNCSISESEVMGTYFAGAFVYVNEPIDEFENCVVSDVTLKSNYKVMNSNNAFIRVFSDDPTYYPILKLTDDKITVESFVGGIKDVSAEGATVTKGDSGYDVVLGEEKMVFLNASYEEHDAPNFDFSADIVTGEITLNSYYQFEDETATEIVFPDDIGGLPVTSINSEFSIDGVAPIKSMVFSGSIKNIPGFIFNFSDDLESLTFKEGVQTIESGAFSYCPSLTTVNFSDSVTEIGYSAFSDCTALDNISFGKNLKTIEDLAFINCRNITSITLPDSVEYVGISAFNGCGSLSVVFGKNIEEIGYRAFGYTGKNALGNKAIKIPDFTVIGYSGTPAETYANEHGFKFVDITSQDAEISQGSFDYSVFVKGDVNLDGIVSVADATILQKYLVDKIEFNQIQEHNALVGDYSNDITIDNATLIQKYLVGLDSLDGYGDW